jgi:hypothetical protein
LFAGIEAAHCQSIAVSTSDTLLTKAAKDSLAQHINSYVPKPNFNLPKEFRRKKQAFAFHGLLSVDFRHSGWRDTFSSLPPTYAQIFFSPTFEFKGVPLRANVFYTTDTGQVGSNLRNISLSLDLPTLQNNIQKSLSDRRYALQQTLNAEGEYSKFHQNYRNTDGWPDLTQRIPNSSEIVSLYNQANYLNGLSAGQIARMRDSVRIYAPESLVRFDSLCVFSQLINLPESEYISVADTLPKGGTFIKKINQVRRLKSFATYKPVNLIGKGDSLYKKGLITRQERVLLNFKKLGMGDVYPSYGDFNMKGIKVKGLEFQYAPQPWSIGFAAGRASQLDYVDFRHPVERKKQVYAGQIGFEDGAHSLKVSFSQFSGGTSQDEKIISPQNFPKNEVMQVEGGLNIKQFAFSTEVALSQKFANRSDAGLWSGATPLSYEGSNTAYRLRGSYALKKTKTQFLCELKRVGTNFYSFGVPYLRNDISQAKVEVEQRLFRQYFVLNGFIMRERDNLVGQKAISSKVVSPGGSISFRAPNLPFVSVSYLPLDQQLKGDLDTVFFRSRYKTIIAQAGHQYRIGSVLFFTGVNAMEQRQYFSEGIAPTLTESIFLSQLIKTKKNVGLSGNIGVERAAINGITLVLTSYDIRLNGNISKKLVMDAGYSRGVSYYQFVREAVNAEASWEVFRRSKVIAGYGFNRLSRPDGDRTNFNDIRIKYQITW